MAARLRAEFATDIEMIHGDYGEFTVLVDGETVVDGGALAALGVIPSRRKIVEAVKRRLSI